MPGMDDEDDELENNIDDDVIAPPATAQELDELFGEIDEGEGTFASLSDEQRMQLKEELGDEWIANYVDDYPVPNNLREAIDEYREIESGGRFPNLTDSVRNDVLLQFDDQYGDGGPDNWDTADE